MKKNIYLTLVCLLIFITAITGLWVWRMMTPQTLHKAALQEQGVFLFPAPRAVPDIALTDHTGQAFTNQNFEGKWTILFFGFTSCPDICPTTMAELKKLADGLKAQHFNHPIQYVLVSVDPERDTPERLASYVTTFDPQFIGATAQQTEITKLGAALNVVVAAPNVEDHSAHAGHEQTTSASANIDHSAELVIINPAGNYHGFIRGGSKAEQIVPLMESVVATF